MKKLLTSASFLQAISALEVAGVNPAYFSWEWEVEDKDELYIQHPAIVHYEHNDVQIDLYEDMLADEIECVFDIETTNVKMIQQINKLIASGHPITFNGVDENNKRYYSYLISQWDDPETRALIDLINGNEVNYSSKRRKYMKQDLA